MGCLTVAFAERRSQVVRMIHLEAARVTRGTYQVTQDSLDLMVTVGTTMVGKVYTHVVVTCSLRG